MVGDLIAVTIPWPALTIALPLAAGIVAMVSGRHGHRLAAPVAWSGMVVAGLVAAQVAAHGPVEIAVGGWPPPLGIALRADGLSAAFLLTASFVNAAALLFARPVFAPGKDGSESRRGYVFWPTSFLLFAGLNATFVGGDLFNLYVALELLSVTAVTLVALEGKPEAVAAAFRYLLFALLGSLVYLLGVAVLYASYGTLDILLLGRLVRPDVSTLIAGALMTGGLMAKMALLPLHGWLPAAHSSAPAPASALLSALVVKAPLVVLLRLWFEAMPSAATPEMAQILGALGSGGILVASLMALKQERLKRLVAYSTVAQLGYVLLVFPLAGGSGEEQPWATGAWSGTVFHAVAHALAKGAMFLSVGTFMEAAGHDRLKDLQGLARDVPMACFAFGLAAVSLMGLPVSGGFMGKYLLLTAAFASGQWWWGLVIVGGGLLAAAYLFRALNVLLAAREGESADLAFVPRGRQALALLLAGLAILLGVLSAGPYRLLQIGRPGTAAEGII